MKKFVLFLITIITIGLFVSCASSKNTFDDNSFYGEVFYKQNPKYASSQFLPDDNRLFFDSYSGCQSLVGNNDLKGAIAQILDDSFVYVGFSIDYEPGCEFGFPFVDAFPCLGSPESANPEDFINCVNWDFENIATFIRTNKGYYTGKKPVGIWFDNYKENSSKKYKDAQELIYQGRNEKRSYETTPIISGVTSFDFVYRETNEFNSRTLKSQMEELLNVNDGPKWKRLFDEDWYISPGMSDYKEGAKDNPKNFTNSSPYDFTLVAHWYSCEFKLENAQYSSIVYDCVSTIETSTVTYGLGSNTVTAIFANFWVEGFEVYNSKTEIWEYYDADEYQSFMENNGLEMPIEFQEFKGIASYCIGEWFLMSLARIFIDSNYFDSIFSPEVPFRHVKHYYSPAVMEVFEKSCNLVNEVKL